MPSLAEQLSLLADPKPQDIDPEDFERIDGEEDEEQTKHVDDSTTREHYIAVGKSRLRENGIQVDSNKYGGHRVSRNEIQDESVSESEEIDNETESSDSDDQAATVDQDAYSEESGSESGSEDEQEYQQPSVETNQEKKRAEFKKLLANEQKRLVSQLSEASKADIDKGESVHHQMNVYAGILDSRIQLQKALGCSNALPLNKEATEKLESEDTAQLLESAKEQVQELLKDVVALRMKMFEADGIVESTNDVKLSRKRTYSAAIANAATLDGKLSSYRDKTLSKWSKKIQASSGASALLNSKFKSLNQTADVQVNTVLADTERLVRRTRVNRSNYKTLGSELSEEQKEEAATAVIENVTQDKKLKGEEDHIFDDTDFYQVLLRNLVEQRMADSQASMGLKWTVSNAKVRRNVDNRATKGRKLRYHVQEKIQGFDAPRNVFIWTDEQKDELFGSLLGQKLKYDENEVDENEEAGQESDVEVEADGLAIFG